MIISYSKQNIDSKDINSVIKSLKETTDPRSLVKEFENKLSKKFKCKFTTVVSNASMALLMSGKIFNWKAGI